MPSELETLPQHFQSTSPTRSTLVRFGGVTIAPTTTVRLQRPNSLACCLMLTMCF
jgi:hypothetical protein